MGCVAAALEGQKFDQRMGPIEEQVEAELACAGQRYVRPISPTRSQAELLTT
jgi:hypothetical protein